MSGGCPSPRTASTWNLLKKKPPEYSYGFGGSCHEVNKYLKDRRLYGPSFRNAALEEQRELIHCSLFKRHLKSTLVELIVTGCINFVVAYLEDLIDNGLDLVTIPEPVASGDLIRPSDFEKYVLPADIKVKERLVGRCPNCLIHVRGRTDKLVSIVAGARVGVFSVDSIDMVRAQQDAAKGCALFGNLNPAQILVAKNAEEVYQISKTLCEQMKPFGGFILAPGCDLAPTIPLENLQAMARAAGEV